MQIACRSSSPATSKTSPRLDGQNAARVSDGSLVDLIATGDRRAFETLYLRHRSQVFRYLIRLIGNDPVAEEIVNDVFLEVWRNAHRFEAKSQVATWLLGIARYKALSALRRRSEAQIDEDAVAAIADPADDPETTADRQSRSAILKKCLAQLPAAQRQVIDLVYFQDKSVEEVAKFVGVAANTIKTRMFYARNRMAGLLNEAGLHGVFAERAKLAMLAA
jgi:RNA polymerase sigma-70 factor (ECF subfamily)